MAIRRTSSFLLISLFLLILALPSLLARGCAVTPYGRHPGGGIPVTITLYRHDTKSLVKMDLEDYLVGVLAAEVPALFEEEALKAQAIVARTYAVKRLRCFGGQGSQCHPEADMCDDPAHGQGWVSEDKARAKWGFFVGQRYWAKLAEAVASTRSLIITHKGVVIDPVYHSTCGGRTEDALAVWSQAVPYLRSVECGFCSSSPKFRSTVEMNLEELARRVGDRSSVIPVMARKEGRKVIEILESSPGGRIQRLKVGNIELKGTEFRQAVGLNSTRFGWQVSGSRIRFEVQGYGHGVGLCQYGANGMAKEGRTAREIISHYFSNVEVVSMWDTR